MWLIFEVCGIIKCASSSCLSQVFNMAPLCVNIHKLGGSWTLLCNSLPHLPPPPLSPPLQRCSLLVMNWSLQLFKPFIVNWMTTMMGRWTSASLKRYIHVVVATTTASDPERERERECVCVYMSAIH